RRGPPGCPPTSDRATPASQSRTASAGGRPRAQEAEPAAPAAYRGERPGRASQARAWRGETPAVARARHREKPAGSRIGAAGRSILAAHKRKEVDFGGSRLGPHTCIGGGTPRHYRPNEAAFQPRPMAGVLAHGIDQSREPGAAVRAAK